MKRYGTAILFEVLLLAIIGMALSSIGIFWDTAIGFAPGKYLLAQGNLSVIDYVKGVSFQILLLCPYVAVLLPYVFMPIWRQPKGMDFLNAGGLGVVGLHWTLIVTGHFIY